MKSSDDFIKELRKLVSSNQMMIIDKDDKVRPIQDVRFFQDEGNTVIIFYETKKYEGK